jgi:hypothetical protein
LLKGHIIKQHCIDAQGQGVILLLYRIDFQLDFDHMASAETSPLHSRPNATGQGNMVVFDEYGVFQSKPVVPATADPDSIFLQDTHTWQSFPRADHLRLVALDRGNDGACRRGDAAECVSACNWGSDAVSLIIDIMLRQSAVLRAGRV